MQPTANLQVDPADERGLEDDGGPVPYTSEEKRSILCFFSASVSIPGCCNSCKVGRNVNGACSGWICFSLVFGVSREEERGRGEEVEKNAGGKVEKKEGGKEGAGENKGKEGSVVGGESELVRGRTSFLDCCELLFFRLFLCLWTASVGSFSSLDPLLVTWKSGRERGVVLWPNISLNGFCFEAG